jgi:5-formyltetrahydrofolate cyclo-ligase
VAITSRAPHITERPVIDLSGSVSQYYEITGNAFDVAVAGLPFIMAVTDSTPYRRQTAEFRTQRVDQSRDPGEQSLSGSGYWIRSQSSFHLGQGINYAEPLEGDVEQIKFRYKSSVGINPWTAGQISLLKKATLQEGSSSRSGVFSTTINGADFLIKVTGASTETIRVLKIATDGTETTVLNNTDITETILYGCMGGNDLMLVTPTKVWRYSFDAASPALHQDYAINTANAASANINYVKQRFILGYTDVNKNTFVYELARNTGSSINLSTLTAVNGSTTLPINFQFTGVTESSGAIYVGGFSGDEGMGFKITVDATGALSTMSRVILLPKGERLTALYGYLGSYVMIGTSRGVRVGVVDTESNVTYGPLVFESTGNVYSFAAENNYVWAGVNNYIGGQSGLVRINLGAPLSNGSYAYATDLVATSTTGAVWAVASFDNGRKAFTVEGSGLWLEHKTDLVESGTIDTGLIRFDTLENKAWKRLRLRTPETLEGDIQIARVKENTADALTTVGEGTTEQYDYDLAVVFTDVSPDAAFRLTLNRNSTDATTGAVLYGYSIKALPTPTRARVIQVPLFCFDREQDKLGNQLGYEGYARQRLNALETVEGAGETIIIQDFTAGNEPTEAVIEQITFTRTTPPNRNFSGFGGVINVILRTVV